MECRGFDAERFIWEWVMIDAQTSNFVCVQFDYFDYHVFYHVGPHVFSIVQPLINSDPYRDGCARLCQSVCATPTVRVPVITIWHRREARSHAYFHTKITLVYTLVLMDTYGYFCMFIPCITIQCVPYLALDLIFGHAKCSTCRLPGQSDHTPSDMQNLLSLLSLPWTGGMLWLPARFLCDPYMGTISVGILNRRSHQFCL